MGGCSKNSQTTLLNFFGTLPYLARMEEEKYQEEERKKREEEEEEQYQISLAAPENYHIMSGKLIRSFRHLEHQNLSISSDFIDIIT